MQEKEAKRRRQVKSTAKLNRLGAQDYHLPLVAMDTALQIEPNLDRNPEAFDDPDEEIVPVDPATFPVHRSALPVPELADDTVPAAPFIIQLPPSSHWASPPTGHDDFALPEAQESERPAEEAETDAVPLGLEDPDFPFMDDETELYLEDDRSGPEFRLVMEEGGKQCTLVYGRGPAEISESVGGDHERLARCQGILTELLAVDLAFKFFHPFKGLYDIDHMPMCFIDVQDKIDGRMYQCFDAFAQDVRQVLDDARSFTELSEDLYDTASRMAEEFDLLIAALPHRLTQVEKESSFQRLAELRFALYRTVKGDLPV
jgi:hypothetical protein